MQYNRVLVLGCPGNGKTTFALKLSTLTGLPVVHLDRLYWNPGWVMRSTEEFHRLMEEALSAETWVMDGNYGGTLKKRLERCELVIYFDLPRLSSMYGVIRRFVTNYGKNRADMGDGCPEKLDWEFIKYTWNFKRDKANRNKNVVIASGKPVIWLCSRRDVRRYLKEIQYDSTRN